MRKSALVILGVGLFAAVGAGYLAYNLVNQKPTQQAAAPAAQKVKTTDILVAKTDIKMGTRIKAENFEWQAWPDSSLSPTYITKKKKPKAINELVGSVARSIIYQHEPVRQAKLVNAESGFMSAILPKGQRAVATSISQNTSAGGFILPNDRVDVVVTKEREGDKNKSYITEVILENIRVLAIDQVIEEKDGESSVVGSTATLQLSPQQVEILAVAQETAERISLTLRSIADSGDKVVLTKKKAGPKRGSVRVIRYGNVETVDATVSERSE